MLATIEKPTEDFVIPTIDFKLNQQNIFVDQLPYVEKLKTSYVDLEDLQEVLDQYFLENLDNVDSSNVNKQLLDLHPNTLLAQLETSDLKKAIGLISFKAEVILTTRHSLNVFETNEQSNCEYVESLEELAAKVLGMLS